MVPRLRGGDTFSDGAGMSRLITTANFLHFNMPHGVDYLNPQLSPEQAWDIAAYVLSQPRPHKAGLDKDFPDLLEKPVDAPYGPYADASASSSTNTGHSRRSAPRSQSSTRRKRPRHPRRRADRITCAAAPRSCP